MKPALKAATVFFLALFALGFVLGTIRVVFVAPRLGPLGATFAELPLMLIAAYYTCRWSVQYWQVRRAIAIRWAMVGWFLTLLMTGEMLLGSALFARTTTEQWAALTTPAGLLGMSAQLIAALLPLFVCRQGRTCPG